MRAEVVVTSARTQICELALVCPTSFSSTGAELPSVLSTSAASRARSGRALCDLPRLRSGLGRGFQIPRLPRVVGVLICEMAIWDRCGYATAHTRDRARRSREPNLFRHSSNPVTSTKNQNSSSHSFGASCLSLNSKALRLFLHPLREFKRICKFG